MRNTPFPLRGNVKIKAGVPAYAETRRFSHEERKNSEGGKVKMACGQSSPIAAAIAEDSRKREDIR
jgi:hypothetical protein